MESVCYLVDDRSGRQDDDDFILYLDTLSCFTGLMVCQGRSDLRGRIYGSIVTGIFHYHTPSTDYVNWIGNLYINRHRLDYLPVLPVLEKTGPDRHFLIFRQDMNY